VPAVPHPQTSARWQIVWSTFRASRVANAGRFRSLDLNPIIVKASGQGVVAVDIAFEANQDTLAADR
jgi:hypothetical protein